MQNGAATVAQIMEVLQQNGLLAASPATYSDIRLTGVSVSANPLPHTLFFVSDPRRMPPQRPGNSVVICKSVEIANDGGPYITTSHPRLAFGLAVKAFWAEKVHLGKIHPTSVIHPTAHIDVTASIGPFCVVGAHSSVGQRTVLSNSVTLGPNVRIGHDCQVRSGTVIGEDGFGVETLEQRSTFRLPHIGGVIVGNHVNIGSLNSIASGTVSQTTIADHVQTDNLVHIAHNVSIGPCSLLTACVEISGSARIGSNVWLGPNCSIMNAISIGDRALVGLGAVVTKSVRDNEVVAGNPARFIRWRRENE